VGGILLAALSLGSLIGGFVYGSRAWPGAPAARLAPLMLVFGAAIALLAAASAAVVLAALLVVCGLLMAPTTVVGSTLLDTVAPVGTVTEAFAAMVMGIVAGTAIGNALGGALVDSASFATAVLTAAAVAAAGALTALVLRRTLG
jgi:predicted MFS family arabinose efflux permease